MERVSKRYVGLATALWHRYRTDIFFQARWNVIGLQIVFGITAFALFWVALQNAQQNISTAIAQGIVNIVSSGGQITGTVVLEQIQATRESEFLKLIIVTVLVAGLFGLFVSRATLLPARSALAAQKRFISNVAHEVRTPLSIIKTNTEVLLMDESIRASTRTVLDETIEEVDRASETLHNLLSLDLYLQQSQVLEFETVKLDEVATAAVQKMKKLTHNRDLLVKVRKLGKYLKVRGNRAALEQVMINLLRNAVAHTPDGGSITVTVAPDYRGFIMLTVQDTGSGIDRKDLPHIFEPYYRAETSRVRTTGNSGLGLTIVSEIVKLHGGQIAVQTKKGKGTTFTVHIPCAAPQQLMMNGVHPAVNGSYADEMTLDFSKKS